MQRLIALGLQIGIGKRELMNDYYVDELPLVLGQWLSLHGSGEEERVDPLTFFGEGGEWVER